MHRFAFFVIVTVLAAPVLAKTLPKADARVELPDLVGTLATRTGKVIQIPGPLETKPSELYTCGHDKKHWIAFEIIDRGKSVVGYCAPGKLPGCKSLAKDASIMHALVKVPACKQAVVELLDF